MSRRIDLSLFRDDDDDDDLPLVKPKVELDGIKAKTFSYGVTKKTKWDLEREAEEKKRKEDEEATKLALQEFSQAFAGGPDRQRGGRPQRGFVRAGEREVYNPNFSREQERDRPLLDLREPSPPPMPKRKGKRAMDAFLEEIKGNQEARETRLSHLAQREGTSVTSLVAHEIGGGPRAMESSNLFVVNLPQAVSEESLGKLFASAGDVGTVKIMWPRDADYGGPRRAKAALTGFVNFMERPAAERALREYDSYEWLGSVLRVSWSKPMPVPRRAAFESTANERVVKKPRRDAAPGRRSPSPQVSLLDQWLDRIAPERASFVKAVVERIRSHGEGFRKVLMERERENPQFTFLFDDKLPEHHLYHHYLNPRYQLPQPPPLQFNDDGNDSVHSTDSGEEGEREKSTAKGVLGRIARRRFEGMLRAMSGKRVEIARAMEFSLKRADAADEISNMICQSLQIDSTAIPRKMARLHLISDILHNSASPLPNVWRYRQAFEKQLPAIFAHFAEVYDRLLVYSGMISADVFRQQVDAVLTIWERWIVFTSEVHVALKRLLYKEITLESLNAPPEEEVVEEVKPQQQFKSAGFKSSFKRIGDSAPVPGPDSGPEDVDGEELDGEAIGDVDGEPIDDVDGEPIEDIDGEAIDDEGEALDGEPIDLDGEPLDADVDGEPLEEGEPADLDGEPL